MNGVHGVWEYYLLKEWSCTKFGGKFHRFFEWYFQWKRLDKEIVGVEKDNYYFSASCLKSLQKNLPKASLTEGTVLVNWQCTLKSQHELVCIIRVSRILEKMYTCILEVIETGIWKTILWQKYIILLFIESYQLPGSKALVDIIRWLYQWHQLGLLWLRIWHVTINRLATIL